MTDGLEYITVRIYRKADDGTPLIKGSGLLFEDSGTYYVFTAYHCLEGKTEPKGELIPFDLQKTEIVINDDEQEVEVHILQEVDKSIEDDWFLMEVGKPNVDWQYEDKVRFAVRQDVGPIHESFPFVEFYEGDGRYTELIAKNRKNKWHINESISDGRSIAASIMKGGSGAGIVRFLNDSFYCFGLLKETLPDGEFNDVCSIRVNDIIPVISKRSKVKLTAEDEVKIKEQSIKEGIQRVKSNIESATEQEEVNKILLQLLENVIPSLLDYYQIEMAKGILDVIDTKVEQSNESIKALYTFCKAQYTSLTDSTEAAYELYHEAFRLDAFNAKIIEHEVRYLMHNIQKDDAVELSRSLPEGNQLRQAIHIATADNSQEEFNHLTPEQQADYILRYKVMEMSDLFNKDSRWICNVIEPTIPDGLTAHNLPAWLYALSCYRVQLGDMIYLTRELVDPYKVLLEKAFSVADHLFFLADKTCIARKLHAAEMYFCYWGYLLHEDEHLYNRMAEIKIEGNETLRTMQSMMLASMSSMQGDYNEAYRLIEEGNSKQTASILHLVSILTCVSHDQKYLLHYLKACAPDSLSVNSAEAGQLANLAGILHPSLFQKVMDVCHFESENDRQLLTDLKRAHQGEKVDLSDYEKMLPDLSDDSVAFAAQILFNNGQKELAYRALESRMQSPSGRFCEEIYNLLISNDTHKRAEHYALLKEMRNAGKKMDQNQLSQLYNYALTLLDYDTALDAILLLHKQDPTDELRFAAVLDITSKSQPEQMGQWVEEIKQFQFQNLHNIQTVYRSLAVSNQLQEAMDFLYETTLRLQSEDLDAYYLQETLIGFVVALANATKDTVTEDTYVLYENSEGNRTFKKPSPTSALGKALIGHHPGEEVRVELSGEAINLTIIRIGNKYGYLHYCLMRDIMESGGNRYFTPFKLNPNQPAEDILNQLEGFLKQTSGDEETPAERERRITEEYLNGEISLIQMIDDTDVIGSYYKYLFTDFRFKVQPQNLIRAGIGYALPANVDYVLDLSSLIMLYEFSLMVDINYKSKFLLPIFIRQLVGTYRKNFPVINSVNLYQAIQSGFLKRLDEHIAIDIDKRLEGLLGWIDDNCTLVSSPDVLNLDTPNNGGLMSELVSRTAIECLPKPNQNRVLLCDDNYPFLFFKGHLPTATAEMYVYDVEGEEVGAKFSVFLSRNHCIGVCLPYKHVVENYILLEQNKDNQFAEIVESFKSSFNINDAILSCRFILLQHTNHELCIQSIRQLMDAVFTPVPEDFFNNEVWGQLIYDESRIPFTGNVIVPLLNEVKHKHTQKGGL